MVEVAVRLLSVLILLAVVAFKPIAIVAVLPLMLSLALLYDRVGDSVEREEPGWLSEYVRRAELRPSPLRHGAPAAAPAATRPPRLARSSSAAKVSSDKPRLAVAAASLAENAAIKRIRSGLRLPHLASRAKPSSAPRLARLSPARALQRS